MSTKALSDYTVYAKYAKYIPEKQRRETWREQVDRVFDMHYRKYESQIESNPKLKEYFEFAKESVSKKLVLGAQRALQFGGKAIERHSEKIYNCSVTYVDRPRVFQEIMFLLLCGCGVGFSVQHKHTKTLPLVAPRILGTKTFTIPDSIEGWADALGIAVISYFVKTADDDLWNEYRGNVVDFDYSLIRPEGSKITGGFKAPGPNGLRKAIERITALVERRLATGETKLHNIDLYDIIMHASDAVLSGGVRRSATICLFSKDDEEMAKAKTGDWFYTNPQRGRSNNSALLLRDSTTKEEFAELMKSVKDFGEPGFVWSDSEDILYNPCFEGNTRIHTDNGLVKIKDLAKMGTEFFTAVDSRMYLPNTFGVDFRKTSTPAVITQKLAKIYRVTTEHGNIVETTDNHTFITNHGRVQLKDLRVGDKLYLQSGAGKFGNRGTYDLGLLLGLVTGDGTIPVYNGKKSVRIVLWEDDMNDIKYIQSLINEMTSHQHNIYYGIQGNKHFASIESTKLAELFESEGINLEYIKEQVPEYVFEGNQSMVTGYIHGMIYCDGSVPNYSDSSSISSYNIGIDQAKHKILLDIQLLLQNFGVVSRLYTLGKDEYYNPHNQKLCLLPDGKGGSKEYWCNRMHRLVINRPNMVIFEQRVGLFGRKQEILTEVLDKRGRTCYKPERFTTTVEKIEYVFTDDVYCFTEPTTNTTIANGIVIGQCVEIGMMPLLKTADGIKTGVQFCNLTEMNGRKCIDKDTFLHACKASAIIGTLQAGYAKFDYLGKVTEDIVKKEALLGCSITGMMDNFEVIFNPENQKEGAKLIKKINKEVAEMIGINQAARTTCVKPAGSTSCVLGTSSGIHPHHARRYFRRVQANKLEFPAQEFQKVNPLAVENSVWSNNGTDLVVTFLCEVPQGAITKNQLSAIQLLENVKLTQQNWVEYGTNKDLGTEDCIRHNVSNTITVNPEEWDDVEKYIYSNRKWFAGISLLPGSGDKDYPQAPFCTIYTPAEIVKEHGDGSVFASGVIVNALRAFDNNLWKACDAVLVSNWKVESQEQQDWIRQAIQFTNRYFAGDSRKMTYCLKDVHNWKTWCDLKREYKEIDWSQVVEVEEYTIDINTTGAQACAGGQCSIM